MSSSGRPSHLIGKFVTVCSGALALALTLPFTGCSSGGGGSSSSGATAATTGSAALLFTDGPTDDFDEIKITVHRVEFLSDERKVQVYDGTKTIDLLKLRTEAALFTLASDIPPACYEKIRLRVSRVLLVRKDYAGNVTEEIEAKLPANGKIDLNPRGCFEIKAGQTLILQIDMDGKNSIHVVEAGKKLKYLFRPVVFIKAVAADFQGRLVRMTGRVKDIDLDNGVFQIRPNDTAFVDAISRRLDAPDEPMPDIVAGGTLTDKDDDDDDEWGDDDEDDDDGDDDDDDDDDDGDDDDDDDVVVRNCIPVFINDETLVVDGEGNELGIEDLTREDKVTVIGQLRFNTGEDTEADEGYPLRASHYDNQLVLDAAVVEWWSDPTSRPYRLTKGTARSVVDPDGAFDFELDPGQWVGGEPEIKVQLLDGAKVYDKEGEPLDEMSIQDGREAIIDAALIRSDTEPDVLITPLVVLGDAPPLAPTKVTGTIIAIDPDLTEITLEVTDPDTSETTEVCVDVTDDTDIFLISLDPLLPDSFDSDKLSFEDLTEGTVIDVYGQYEGTVDDPGCLTAHDILLVDVIVPTPL